MTTPDRKRVLDVFFTLILLGALFPYAALAETEEYPPEDDAGRIVITAADIGKMNVRSVTDLLNQIPGVTAGEYSVRIRGSSMVRVILDGRPINDPLSGHRAIKWNLVSLNSIERIEIYKGEGSVMFGENTTGGVISITTKKTELSHGSIDVSAGNLETLKFSIDYRSNIGGAGIGISAGLERTGGYLTNGDKEKKRAGFTLGYMHRSGNKTGLSLDYSEEKRGIPGLPAFPTPEARSEAETAGLTLTAKLGRIQSRTFVTTFDKKHANPAIDLKTVLSSWSIGEGLSTTVSTAGAGIFDIGVQVELAGVEGNRIRSQHEERYGIYATKSLRLRHIPMVVNLGLRGNFHSDFPPVVNPEIMATLNRDGLILQGSFSMTNNAPTFIQRYYETSTTKINPDLGMERSVNYNMSIFYRRHQEIEGSLSLFFSKTDERITYVRQDDGTGSYENLGEVTRRGTELSLKWEPSGLLKVRPSYTYLMARDEITGNRMPYTPEHRIKMNIQYRPLRRLILGLDTQYVSEQFSRSDNTESVPAYSITGFRGEYHLEKLELFVSITNLFNKRYYYGDGLPAPPRTWLAGAGYEF